MSTKTIRITKCSDSAFWYNGREGESFPLLFQDGDEFVVRVDDVWTNIVKVGDGMEGDDDH